MEVHIMPRRDDIETAFRQSIVMEPSGRRTVTTESFVAALQRFNWDWDCVKANQWIKSYTHNWRDASTQEGENKTWHMFNPNGGL